MAYGKPHSGKTMKHGGGKGKMGKRDGRAHPKPKAKTLDTAGKTVVKGSKGREHRLMGRPL